MSAGDTQRINAEKSIAEHIRTLAAIVGILGTLAGLIGAFYVTIERVSALQAEVGELKGWQRAAERDMAAQRERELASKESGSKFEGKLEGIEKTLGNLQRQLSMVCVSVRGARCE